MIKAFDKNKNWIEVSFSGELGYCPVCNEQVFGKIYFDKSNHFAHFSKSDCSVNTGKISDWHLDWQSRFKYKEIYYPENGLRADVVLDHKTVIEFQHSNITFSELRRREEGYKKMIWLFDCIQFEKNIYEKNGFIYWIYPKKNWLYFTKPAFFQIESEKIIQFRNIDFEYDTNNGGYTMPILKAEFFRVLTCDQFIDECYMMDEHGRKIFEICENIEILRTLNK